MHEDDGQDLIEYALLASFIALAGVAGYNAIANSIGGSYTDWNTTVQDIWEVPEP
jgi:Flp pilus assembly pilin Flp